MWIIMQVSQAGGELGSSWGFIVTSSQFQLPSVDPGIGLILVFSFVLPLCFKQKRKPFVCGAQPLGIQLAIQLAGTFPERSGTTPSCMSEQGTERRAMRIAEILQIFLERNDFEWSQKTRRNQPTYLLHVWIGTAPCQFQSLGDSVPGFFDLPRDVKTQPLGENPSAHFWVNGFASALQSIPFLAGV